MDSFEKPVTACVIGASGGIGGAIVKALAAEPSVAIVHAGSRIPLAATAKIKPFVIDVLDDRSIEAAAVALQDHAPLHMIVIATGQLHDGKSLQPEKSYRALSADAFARAFAINATGPALVARHFLPLLPRDSRAIFAALSARVSSISDNRLGGWHAYRASKAALNMIVRNLAIELARTHPQTVAVTLHPGTVDTALSEPFQNNVVPQQLFTPEYSAAQLLSVLNGLQPGDSGNLYAWDGQSIAY